jgi:hypothetical protein
MNDSYFDSFNHETVILDDCAPEKEHLENYHYIKTSSPSDLHHKFVELRNNTYTAEQIANNSFDFFKKYLLSYDNILYYMYKLLNEYSSKIDYNIQLTVTDKLITDIRYNEYINS